MAVEQPQPGRKPKHISKWTRPNLSGDKICQIHNYIKQTKQKKLFAGFISLRLHEVLVHIDGM